MKYSRLIKALVVLESYTEDLKNLLLGGIGERGNFLRKIQEVVRYLELSEIRATICCRLARETAAAEVASRMNSVLRHLKDIRKMVFETPFSLESEILISFSGIREDINSLISREFMEWEEW